MDIKWKNIFKKKKTAEPGGNAECRAQNAECTAGPGHTVGHIRALCGFLAFVLGVTLTVEGGCFFWNNLSSSSGRQWWEDSFQEDYQNTRQFQSYVEDYLETLLTIGAGGPVEGYGRWYGGYDVTAVQYDTYLPIAGTPILYLSLSTGVKLATTISSLPSDAFLANATIHSLAEILLIHSKPSGSKSSS